MPSDPKTPAPRPILVVDDDPALLRSLRLILELDGFTVITAENGVRGLQAFRNLDPAVVLIDIMMPKLDGIETVRQMRRERPGAKVIVMSGSARLGDLDFAAAARELGAVAALEKPFDPAALTSLLRDLIRQAA
jgi:DNA-binding response OmpR family regulator